MRIIGMGEATIGERIAPTLAGTAEWMRSAPVGTQIRSEATDSIWTKQPDGLYTTSTGRTPLPAVPQHTAFTWVSFPDGETGPKVGDLLPIDSDANLQAALNAAEVGTVIKNEKARGLVLLFTKQADGRWHRPASPGRNGASTHNENTFPVGSFNTNLDYIWVSFPEVPKTDVQKIGQALIAEATRRGWCPDYDLFIAALNETLDEKLPAR